MTDKLKEAMKPVIYSVLTAILAYFAIAFVTWEIDSEKWTWIGRFAFVWMAACAIGITLTITLEEKK